MKAHDYILFEDYLSGTLSESAEKSFRSRLEEDSRFSEAFNLYRETSEYLQNKFEKAEATQAFEADLKQVSDHYFGQDKMKRTSSKSWLKWVAAASVVILVGLFVSNWFSAKANYADYAHYPDLSLGVRGTNSSLLTKAEHAFNAKQYDKAAAYFARLAEHYPENISFQIYRAVSLVELSHYSQADALFNNIIKQNSVYRDKAIWYAALSQLKQKKYESCADLLKKISKDSAFYKKAMELLGDLP